MNFTNQILSIPLFSQLSSEQINRITAFSKITELKKGNILFYEGEKADNLYILIDGEVKIYKSGENGKEFFIHRFQPVSSIAEMPFFEELNFPATAVASKNSKITVIDGVQFREFLFGNPLILFKFITSLTKKIKMLEQRIENSVVLSAKERVIKFIAENGERFRSMKRKEVAEELHITPEHLSRVLKEIKC